MRSTRTIPALLIAAASAAPLYSNTTSCITWAPCNQTEVGGSLPVQCATLQVPLDYTDLSSNETLQLDLTRVPATAQPSKGSILLNFGGPGEPSRVGLAALGPLLREMSAGEFDLVTLDPRGTGNTIPFECYTTELEAQGFVTQLTLSNASEVQVGAGWAAGTVTAATCKARAGKIGELISTPFVARDFMSVVDALGEDGMLRYWGFSYGTTLGATIAAMFPERIEKIILDGVQNPHEYYHALSNFEEWVQADYVFSSMFTGCVAAPENCTLSKRNMSAADLEQATWDLLDRVKYEPIVVADAFPVSYAALKGFIQNSMYDIATWPNMTTIIDMLLNDSPPGVEILPYLGTFISLDTTPLQTASVPQSLVGIQCGDRTARASSLAEFYPVVDKLYNISKIYGDAALPAQSICAQWSITPKERYTGPFTAQTKGPMLIIGNTGDALTPVVSARNVSAGFAGSEVLVVDGFGHTALGPPSSCTLRATRTFWRDGTLPAPGTVCEVEGKPFSGVQWEDLYEGVVGARDLGMRRRSFGHFV